MKDAKAEVAGGPGGAAAAPASRAGPEADTTVYKVEAGKSPSRGPKNAAHHRGGVLRLPVPVLLARRADASTQLEKEYPGKVRMVWKNFPLGFHQNAKPAARPRMAAGEQGKFWQMHDKLFANQQALDRASLEKYAQELGLDMAKFKAGHGRNKYKAPDRRRHEGGPGAGRPGHAGRLHQRPQDRAAPTRTRRSRRSPTRSWPRRRATRRPTGRRRRAAGRTRSVLPAIAR